MICKQLYFKWLECLLPHGARLPPNDIGAADDDANGQPVDKPGIPRNTLVMKPTQDLKLPYCEKKSCSWFQVTESSHTARDERCNSVHNVDC